MKLSAIEIRANASSGSQMSAYTSIWFGLAEPVSDARMVSRKRSPYALAILATNGAPMIAATMKTRIPSIR